MKNTLRTLLVSVSLVMSASTVSAMDSGSQGVVQAITQLENQWANAILKADVAAQDKIEAPDYTISSFDGSIASRAENDADLTSGVYKCASFTIDEMKVSVYGDSAIVHGSESEKSTYKGADTSGQYRFTDVFVKQGDAWVAVTTHVSKVAK